jgi:hypothetical protein
MNRGDMVNDPLSGEPASPKSLAKATEQALLHLADMTPDPDRRSALVNQAARARPWATW